MDDTSKIKVMHIISDLDAGGAQYCVLDYIRALDSDRYETHVCCLRKKGILEERLIAAGATVHLCRFESRYSPIALYRLSILMKENKIDVVHTHCRRANHVGRLGALLAGIPALVAHHHDTILEKKKRQKAVTSWLAKRTGAILCASGEVRRVRLSEKDEPEDKLRVFHNFVFTEDYIYSSEKNIVRQELGVPVDKKLIGIVGRLHPLKDHGFFLEVAKILSDNPDYHFVIVGDGKERADIEARIKELGLSDKVTMTGRRDDMPRVYACLDILALTSIQEGFPKVFLEAQATGVPVVTLNVGGAEEALAGGGGVIVKDRDPNVFADALVAALDADTLKKLSQEAVENVKNFSAQAQGRALMGVYESLLHKS